MEDTLSRVHPECIGQLSMTVASADPSPEAAERWGRRAELLTGWLLAMWRREQARLADVVIDDPQRFDDGAIRGFDLN